MSNPTETTTGILDAQAYFLEAIHEGRDPRTAAVEAVKWAATEGFSCEVSRILETLEEAPFGWLCDYDSHKRIQPACKGHRGISLQNTCYCQLTEADDFDFYYIE